MRLANRIWRHDVKLQRPISSRRASIFCSPTLLATSQYCRQHDRRYLSTSRSIDFEWSPDATGAVVREPSTKRSLRRTRLRFAIPSSAYSDHDDVRTDGQKPVPGCYRHADLSLETDAASSASRHYIHRPLLAPFASGLLSDQSIGRRLSRHLIDVGKVSSKPAESSDPVLVIPATAPDAVLPRTDTKLVHRRDRPRQTTRKCTAKAKSPVVKAYQFKRWKWLIRDSDRLNLESDLFPSDKTSDNVHRLLVDRFDNRGDFELWTALLEFQTRINGSVGTAQVWKGLWGRKSLYDVTHPLAPTFFRTMLEAALASSDDKMLEQVWIYSEWMLHMHGSRWPDLYTTIMVHMLKTHQHQNALSWQLRLSPSFYPGPDVFAAMIKQFATDKEYSGRDTLQNLYFVNRDHQLYGTLVPHLFNLGQSSLAKRWRDMCLNVDDFPSNPAPVRPFLRFLQAYLPSTDLAPEELMLVNSNYGHTEKTQPDLSREFFNRVYGRTFGIAVKTYDDKLGSRWFASSWVSLDMAISTVATLGIAQIGPLSIQSIGLRSQGSEEFLRRIHQLKEHGVSATECGYNRLIRHLADRKDDELLNDLLKSDLHPDVFDDLDLQTRLIDNATSSELHWRTLRILLASQHLAFERSARALSNNIVQACYVRRDLDGLRNILEDMRARHVPLDLEQAQFIFDSIREQHKFSKEGITLFSAKFHIALFRRLTSMDIPVPLSHWKMLMHTMIRNGWSGELEKLCLKLVDYFLKSTSLRPGFVPLYFEDVPAAMREPVSDVENLIGIYVPQDISVNNNHHPLQRLFSFKLLGELIDYAFAPVDGGHVVQSAKPGKRHHTQASRIEALFHLLRALHKRGVHLPIGKLRDLVCRQLVLLYSVRVPPTENYEAMKRKRASNVLTLKQMRRHIALAWDNNDIPILPHAWNWEEYVRSHSAKSPIKSKTKGKKGRMLVEGKAEKVV
ncbi:hypothetical protein F5Y18DRAFT_161072 [Xylariaceae sp. FL1019]|nr:hypothetical protein F5Y18DRAFT_161072 [Xylariaceae sp. FL1019]